MTKGTTLTTVDNKLLENLFASLPKVASLTDDHINIDYKTSNMPMTVVGEAPMVNPCGKFEMFLSCENKDCNNT